MKPKFSSCNKTLLATGLPIAIFLAVANSSYGQLSINNTSSSYTIDFSTTVSGVNNGVFNGSGFQGTPSSGQLDSDAWAVTGFSDGSLAYGGTRTTASTDYTRGATFSSTGGIYGVTASGNTWLAIRPVSSDFAPGTLTLRVQNTSASTITGFNFGYDIRGLNDQARSSSFNFSWSTNDTAYTSISALDYTSTTTADGSPAWASVARSNSFSSLSLATNDYIYLRWSGADVGGSNSRDGFGLDNITLNTFTTLALTGNYWVGADSTLGGAGTWTATGGTAWSTTAADVAGAAFDSAQKAIFGGVVGTSAVTVDSTVSAAAGIDFTTGGYTLSGGSITLSGANAAANTITVASTTSATIGTELTGTTGMTKSGAGNLILSSTNGYTGGTSVSAGTLTLGHATDTLSDSAALTVSGILALGSNSDTIGSLSLTGGSISGSGTLTAATYSLGGGTVTANLGAGSATASSGTTALNGSLAADLSVTGGTVNLGSADRLGNSSAVSITSGTLGMATFTNTVGSFSISGTGSLGGTTGTITAATYSLGGGTLTANLGVGAATAASGTTALNGKLAGSLDVTGGTVNLGSSNRIDDSSSVSISSGTLGLSSNTDTVGNFSISGGALSGSGTLTAATYSLGGGTLTANLGAGAATAASGTTALNGTLAGGLTVSGGTVNLGSTNRMGDSSAVSISSGTLGISTFTDTVGSFSISGTGSLGGTTGTLTAATYSLGGGTLTANLGAGAATAASGTTALNGTLAADLSVTGGTVNLGSADRIGNTAVSISSGTLDMGAFNDTVGSFSISGGTLGGSGTLTAATYGLQGGTINARLGAGLATVSSGTTSLGSAGRLGGTTSLAVTGGQLSLGGNESTAAYTQSGGTLAGTGSLTATSYGLSGGTSSVGFAGSGAVTVASGTANLNGNSTGFTGATTVSGGTLALGNSAALGSSAVTISSGSVLGGDGITTSNAITIGTAASTANNPFSIVWNFGTSSGNATASSSNAVGFTVGSVTVGNNNGSSTMLTSGSVSDYSGASGQFNAGAATVDGTVNTTTSTYFTLNLARTTATSVSLNDISFGSRSTGTGPTGYSIRNASALGTSLASGSLSANGSWSLQSPAFTDTAITGGSGTTFRIYGSGGSGANLNTVVWRIDDLTLTGTSTTNVTASGSGTLGINTTGSTTYSGGITVNNTATLTAVSGGTANFTNSITGPGSIEKSGLGVVALSGTNSYLGATTVSAGTLAVGVAGTGSLTSAVTVSNAGTKLAGSGTITGNVVVNSGAILAPGNSVGILTTAGITTLDTGSIFEWELAATPATTGRGTSYDAVKTTALTGSGAIFQVVLSGSQNFSEAFWKTNQTWTNLFTNVAGDNNLSIDSVFTGGFQYRNETNGMLSAPTALGSFTMNGSNLTWTAVPEPSSALAGLLLGAGLLRRRRSA